MFDAEHSYAFDIETDTSGGYGLDPRKGGITEIALAFDATVAERFEAAHGGIVYSVEDGLAEEEVIIEFDRTLARLEPGVLFTWNGSFFDLPFILSRAEMLDIAHHLHLRAQPGLKPKYEPLPGHVGGYSAVWGSSANNFPHQHIDIQRGYERYARDLGIKWRLKPVAHAYGIDMVDPGDRSALHLMPGDKRVEYALSDANGTRLLGMHQLGLTVPEVTDPFVGAA